MELLPILTASAQSTPVELMRFALVILVVILAVLFFSSVIFTVVSVKTKKLSTASGKGLLAGLYITTIVVLVCTALCFVRYQSTQEALLQNKDKTPTEDLVQTDPPSKPTEKDDPIVSTTPDPPFTPSRVSSTDPSNWNVVWEIISQGAVVDSFQRADSITFGRTNNYSTLEGIITFRGNNFRSGPTYGTATVTNQQLSKKWSRDIGSLNGWPGSGWTGQPLIVRWDKETKQIMNMYADKKAKDGLVEVIYATLDGYVYFYDLDDGSYTRDPIFLGMNFKGAGSLDPRGYPLMYVGSGDVYNGKAPRMYIVSLIDGSILFEKSGADGFSKRNWYAFDSSPLVDAETDTLIWPGESGILYTFKLNSVYDKTAGTISIDPEEVVKTRYTAGNGRTLGYECSCIIVESYLYLGDNSGMFYCIDINTMELVWALDTKDDTNATPVFEWGEDGNGYIYTATSMEFNGGTSIIYKLNAQTGEVIWSKEYSGIVYDQAVSGGVLSSPVLGKEGTNLEGMIVYSISKTPQAWQGILVALDTETGEVVWEMTLDNYAWSSPAPIYTDDGKAYILICDSAGIARLLDAPTGKVLSTLSLGSNVEASPAVFGNTAVVGTRGRKIYAITID